MYIALLYLGSHPPSAPLFIDLLNWMKQCRYIIYRYTDYIIFPQRQNPKCYAVISNPSITLDTVTAYILI